VVRHEQEIQSGRKGLFEMHDGKHRLKPAFQVEGSVKRDLNRKEWELSKAIGAEQGIDARKGLEASFRASAMEVESEDDDGPIAEPSSEQVPETDAMELDGASSGNESDAREREPASPPVRAGSRNLEHARQRVSRMPADDLLAIVREVPVDGAFCTQHAKANLMHALCGVQCGR